MSKIKKSPWGEGAILSPQNPLIGKARRLLAGTSEIERAGVKYALDHDGDYDTYYINGDLGNTKSTIESLDDYNLHSFGPWLVTCVISVTGNPSEHKIEIQELEYTANLNGLLKTEAIKAIRADGILNSFKIHYQVYQKIYKLRVPRKNPGDTELLNALITYASSTKEAYEAQFK